MKLRVRKAISNKVDLVLLLVSVADSRDLLPRVLFFLAVFGYFYFFVVGWGFLN